MADVNISESPHSTGSHVICNLDLRGGSEKWQIMQQGQMSYATLFYEEAQKNSRCKYF